MAMRDRAGIGRAWWLMLAWLLATCAAATPRIGLMTMQPGTIFWERFGHDAIVVDNPARGAPVSFNFGFFDPTEPGFAGRYARGDMQYQLVALPLADDLQTYRDEGRGVRIQWLDLDPSQADALEARLERNALPENARYHYDPFRDNCTTRVRDAIDGVLGGRLHDALQSGSNGESYRSESLRLASPTGWMWLLFEIGLGPDTNPALSHWDDAFVPQRLADSVATVTRTDGRPLVSHAEELVPHRLGPPAELRVLPVWGCLAVGLLVALAILVVGRRHPRAVAAVAVPFWLMCGTIGAVLLYAWLGTEHWALWRNANLLLFNPLCLLLAWPGLRRLAGRPFGGAARWMAAAVAAFAVAAVFVLWLLRLQPNGPWLALLVPLHLALAWLFARRAALAAG